MYMYMRMRLWIQIQIDGLLKPHAIEQVVSFTTKISNNKGMTLVDPSIWWQATHSGLSSWLRVSKWAKLTQ